MEKKLRFLEVLKSREGKPLDIERLKKDCQKRLANKNLIVAYLYGAYATGNPHKLSDVDIAILFEPSVPKEEYLDRELDLIGIFQDLTEDEAVDLGVLNGAPIFFKFQVLKTGLPIFCSDERKRVEFEAGTMAKYYDFRPLFLEYQQALFQRIKEGEF